MNSFDAPPWSLQLGANRVTMNPFKTEFSGRILSAKRLPATVLAETHNNGLWRIRCTFPQSQSSVSYPLLSTGVGGSGTLVYLNALPAGGIRFGVDEWGYGGGLSAEVKSAPGSEHEIEILIGPLATRYDWPPGFGVSPRELGQLEHALVVWLDGRQVWRTELRRPVESLDSMFDVGGNSQGFTAALAEFPGSIQSRPYSPNEARDFLRRCVGIGR
jgi:hypothetical protein